MTIVLALFLLHNVFLAAFGWWRPWPRNAGRVTGLNFWIVILAADEKAIRAALALDSPEYPVRLLCQEARQSKGDALNSAYRHIRDMAVEQGNVRETIIGVVHGDGCAEPGTLKEVAGFFGGRRVGAVQCQTRANDRLQDLAYSCAEDASQSLRDVFGCVKLGGNGQFVRLTSLMRLGDRPWSGCLGLRLHVAGIGIRYAKNAVFTQRRARPGQDLRYVPQLVRKSWIQAFAVLAPWLAAPVFVAMLALTMTTGDPVWLAALLGLGMFRLRPGGWKTLAAGILYPVFLVLRMVAPWWRLLCAPKRVTNVVPVRPVGLLPWTNGHPGLSARRP